MDRIPAIKHLNIEITSRCNQKCFYCFNHSEQNNRTAELSTAQWLEGLASLRTKGLCSVLVTGGEPFLVDSIVELLEGIQALGLTTSILSNGTNIPKHAKANPEIFRKLAVAQISLDSMDPAIHDQRRGIAGAWKQAMSAIDALGSLEVPIEISATIGSGDEGQIPDLISFCKHIGAQLLLRPLQMLGKAATCPSGCLSPSKRLMAEITDGSQAITSDRFHYLPISQHEDELAMKNGSATVDTQGRFRYHPFILSSYSANRCMQGIVEFV